jgi:hypothetical protein
MKARFSAFVLVAVLASCGPATDPQFSKQGTGVDETVFVRTPEGLLSVESSTGDQLLDIPNGLGSPDFSVLAATEPEGDGTLVRLQDPTGAPLKVALLPGAFVPRVLSGNGTLLALAAPRANGVDPYLPEGRAESRIAVVGSSGGQREYVLDGNFEPEAFSVNGKELFMIEYIPALAPTEYRVRRLLLESGRVVAIGRLKSAAPDQMNGTGRNQVYAPDGTELYTLYTQQGNPGHGHETGGDHAFIHLLNLQDSWAHCIDLPHVFGHGRATASAVAVTPRGDRLFVADWTNGAVAVISPRKIKVVDQAEIRFGDPDERTFAQATEDRLYVAGNSEVVVMNGGSLEVLDRWSLDGEITGLRLSADGRRLYTVVSGEVVVLDATTGRVVGALSVPDAAGIDHVAVV